MNLFQVAVFCTDEVKGVLYIVKTIIRIVTFVIPLILIAYGTFDIFKAMTSGKEEDQKKAVGAFVKRIIYALVIFLIPFIISLVFNLFSSTFSITTGNNADDDKNFFECYKEASSVNLDIGA